MKERFWKAVTIEMGDFGRESVWKVMNFLCQDGGLVFTVKEERYNLCAT